MEQVKPRPPAANRIISVSCATNSMLRKSWRSSLVPARNGNGSVSQIDSRFILSFAIIAAFAHFPIHDRSVIHFSVTCRPAGRSSYPPRLPRQLQVAGSPKPSLRPLRGAASVQLRFSV